ncbi:hypothetical protein BO99DRAFT_32315 [Aspergillus violaceofuscus CBS 115571]|uniref:Uncharacterized protein n=1 Tax=Aspergillus violaceofuscus (strain CBS 115571) TaxID=1450538 RepID=A0A2V5I0T5_ASPV1|nr:hypothetical protein BO99DRAFT_32315 [Aspergillus violaceofuscus CBS 115571]
MIVPASADRLRSWIPSSLHLLGFLLPLSVPFMIRLRHQSSSSSSSSSPSSSSLLLSQVFPILYFIYFPTQDP